MSKAIDKEKFIAKLISFIANPILAFAIAFALGNWDRIKEQYQIFGIFLFIGCFFPLLLYFHYLYVHRDNFLSYAAIPRDKRNNIYLTTIISFCLNVIMFMYTGQSKFWTYSSMLIVILFATFYLLNRFIDKPSIHASMFAFATLYLTNKINVAFALLLFLIPFIGWSRVKLHKHTWFQIVLGAVIGMFIGLLSWTF